MSNPLRYNISSWIQLAECKSNNSTDLYITVKQVVDDGSHRLMGLIILVNHTQYGTLFACMVNADGTLLTKDSNSGIIWEFNTEAKLVIDGKIVPDPTRIDLTKILATFGFDVTFEINQHLSGDQISYLLTLRDLGFDKLRMLEVQQLDGLYSNYLVAFNVDKCPEWIKNDFTCGRKPFLEALNSSGAMNLTDLKQTKDFDWTWLTYVANIEDIIRDNNGEGD